jgi:hypothetical protein
VQGEEEEEEEGVVLTFNSARLRAGPSTGEEGRGEGGVRLDTDVTTSLHDSVIVCE